MSLAQEYTEDWLGYWTYVAQRTSDGWTQALRQIQNREYELKHLVGDVVGYWSDIAVASVTAIRGHNQRPPLVVFQVDVADDAHPPETVPVVFAPALPYKEPQVALFDPVWTEGKPPTAGKPILPKNFCARLLNHRRELELKLVDLNELNEKRVARDRRKLLAPAIYRAIVHVDECALAEWVVVVSSFAK